MILNCSLLRVIFKNLSQNIYLKTTFSFHKYPLVYTHSKGRLHKNIVTLLPDSDSGNDLELTDDVTVIDDVTVEDDVRREEDTLVKGVPEYFTAENRSQRKVQSYMCESPIVFLRVTLLENGCACMNGNVSTF